MKEYVDNQLRSIEDMREAERKRIAQHALECYNAWHCQSCGCRASKLIACPSHAGNNAHTAALDARRNELLERIADALGVPKP
jgi:hypothetical protein